MRARATSTVVLLAVLSGGVAASRADAAGADLTATPGTAPAGTTVTFRLVLGPRIGVAVASAAQTTIAFGDGTTQPLTVARDGAGYGATATHAYARAGRYVAAVSAASPAAPRPVVLARAPVTIAAAAVIAPLRVRPPIVTPAAAAASVMTPLPRITAPPVSTERTTTHLPSGPDTVHRVAVKVLRFGGFTVGGLTLAPSGDAVDGTGSAHVADLTVPVSLHGVKYVASGETGTVTSGSATSGAHDGARTSPLCRRGLGTAMQEQLGVFHRFGYTFALMGLDLGPASGPSHASLCFAPPGVESASGANAFNVAATASDGTLVNQLVLAVAGVTLDEDGAFAADLSATAVGSYRMGRTPFTTSAQPVHLGFAAGSADPHISCAGTSVNGPILQIVYRPSLSGTVSDCAWMPDGIRATLAVTPGVAFNVSEPWQFELVVASSALKIAKSAFLGGPMSGTFAANTSAPIPVLTATVAPSPAPNGPGAPPAQQEAYRRALIASAQYNAAAAHAFTASFTTFTATKTTANDPSGTFGGTFDDHGDLRATATQIGPFRAGPYVVTPSSASLFVSGGQAAHRSQDDFKNYLEGMDTNARFDPAAAQGNAPLPGTVPDGSPGLFVDKGLVKAPFTTGPFAFSASSGDVWGLFFSDGGGSSGAVSLAANIAATLEGFPIALTSLNALIFDGSVIRTNLQGHLSLAAPISAQVPVVVQGTDAAGNLLSGFVPAGTTIPLAAWGASLVAAGPMPLGADGIAVDGSHLSINGYGASPAVDGKIVPSGGFSLGLLVPNPALAPARLAGLDYTPYAFSLQSSGGSAQPARIVGQGSLAGWTTGELVALVASGGGFVPAKNYTFSIARSEGAVDFDATIGYANGGWAGRGTISAEGLIHAPFGFRADDTSESGAIGISVPQLDGGGSASGGSSSGLVSMANVGGSATFARDSGSLRSLAFGSDLNLSSFAGHMVMLYHTDVNDPIVAQFGGGKNLAARGWNCKAAWCFAGSAAMTLDSSNSIAGELDGLYDGSGFALYVDGMLHDPIVDVAVQAQLGFYGDDGEFDVGFGFTPIPILAIQFGGKVCVWNHSKGKHTTNCLDTGHAETGAGFLAGGHADVDLGPIAGASVDAVAWYDGAGFGGHVHGHGDISILGVGPSVDADLGASQNPFGFSGSATLAFCACVGSIDATVGASWYKGSGFNIDSASLSLSGPCGACQDALDVIEPWNW